MIGSCGGRCRGGSVGSYRRSSSIVAPERHITSRPISVWHRHAPRHIWGGLEAMSVVFRPPILWFFRWSKDLEGRNRVLSCGKGILCGINRLIHRAAPRVVRRWRLNSISKHLEEQNHADVLIQAAISPVRKPSQRLLPESHLERTKKDGRCKGRGAGRERFLSQLCLIGLLSSPYAQVASASSHVLRR